jgi:hypothetical protein
MAMRVHAAASTVLFLVSLSILMPLGPKGRAVAESACIEQPGRAAPLGERWYYHFDREKNRKCWHLGSAGAAVFEGPPLHLERARPVTSSLNSVFGPVFRGVRNLFRQPMSHEPAAGEPRIVQSDATRPLTIDDIAQQPEFPEGRAEMRPMSSLTVAQRKALFEEYVRWEELRRHPGGSPGGAVPAPGR